MKIKPFIISLMALVCSVATRAEELPAIEPDTTAMAVVDSVAEDPDPEWYVAPLDYDSVMSFYRAPRRAAAADCLTDSVLTFDVDSNLVSVSVYEYGDTTRTIIWDVNTNGSRVGQSKEESATTDLVSYSASYDWDDNTNNWKGISKTVYVYNASHKMESNTSYVWVDGAWAPDTRYAYTYDANNRETEYVYYTRNTTTNALAPNKSRIQGWDDASRKILEINYTAHDGAAWTAGNKKEWVFDAQGNKTDYTYYSAYSNGNWVNSTHEIWSYDASNRTIYYKKDTWTAEAWKTSNEEFTGYDSYGNINSLERYALRSGNLAGSFKEEYVYDAGGEQTSLISYKWTTGVWVYNYWSVNNFDDDGNEIENCRYTWKNNDWAGTGTRTLHTYTSGRMTEEITQRWPTDATDWVNSTRLVYEYIGTKKTHEASYVWQTDYWKGTSRTDYHYTSNKNDTTWTYIFNTDWVYSERVVNTFNSKGTNIMVHNASWNGSAWVMTSMTRTDLAYDAANHQILKATWSCAADSVWVGGTKDTTAYSAAGKQIYTARYTYDTSISDWKPASKTETDYDTSNRQIDKRVYSWNATTNSWKGTSRTQTVYDAKGNKVIEATYNGWIAATNSWKGNKKTEKTFNTDNLVSSMVLSNWNTSTNDWKPTTRYTYSYDESHREILQTVENYSNDWTFSVQYFKEYNGSKQVKNNTYQWLNNQWVFSARNESYYDEDAQAKLRRQITGSWNNGAVSSFADNLYAYSCDIIRTYLIRFVNYDGTELQSSTLAYGATPEYTGTPSKPATAQYTYTFTGWNPAIAAVTADAVYTAQYDSVVNEYPIVFRNEDGTKLDSMMLAYGETPTTTVTPSKPATAEYSYEFADWTPAIAEVTGAATYTATYSSTTNNYTVIFQNYDGTELQSSTLAYGATPEYTGTPSKPATAQYTYTFTGWNPEIAEVTADVVYTAQYDSVVNTYPVVFRNEDGTKLDSMMVAYGETPTTSVIPSKPATAEYTYEFADWTPAIVEVTGAATYTATFTNTTNNYTVIFQNYDGTELQSSTLAYGATPEYTGTPSKPATAQYTYTFTGWNPAIAAVTADAVYTAQYDSVVNEYPIVFRNEDGTKLDSMMLAYGETPATTVIPSKPATAEYTYEFAGWTPTIAEVTGAATYTATYTSTTNNYTIVFQNYDGTELQSSTLAYGATPEYTGTPTKPATAQYTYTFTGWNPTIAEVTADAVYTAQFDSTVNEYPIVFRNEDGTKLDSMMLAYGETPATTVIPSKPATAEYTYEFNGWTPAIAEVTGAATYTATFTNTTNSYTITFYYEDGVTKFDEVTVSYGETPTTQDVPSKPADEGHTYTFVGWSPEVVPATENASYVATFDTIVNTYSVTFKNYDGTVLLTTEVAYGTVPTYTGETPTKAATAQYTYTFNGWTPELTAVTGEATYTATFSSTVNKYTITFYDEDGVTVLEQTNVAYGEMPNPFVTPTKDEDDEYTYEFAGWTPSLKFVTEDASYYATYTATKKTNDLWDINAGEKATKVMIDGHVYILRSGKTYTLDGTMVE